MKFINRDKNYRAFSGDLIEPDQLLPKYKTLQELERKYPKSIMLFTNHTSYEAYGSAWSLIDSGLGTIKISAILMTPSADPEDATVAVWLSVDGIEKELIKIWGTMGHSVLVCTIAGSIYRIHRIKVELLTTDSGETDASVYYSEEESGQLLT